MTDARKTLCVIGAGPAGLVAAKTFLETGNFVVTVYEAADRVGGMWRAGPGEDGDKCSAEMRTNLSRFTVAFSDLAWTSVDLSEPATAAPPSQGPPMFPRAWEVGRYLKTYADKFNVTSRIMFNKTVHKVERMRTSNQFVVTFSDTVLESEHIRVYDYLVVATGFFDQSTTSFNPSTSEQSKNHQHSSKFRTLAGLTSKAGKIAVIGGGISGAEAAAQAAFQISNEKNSPNANDPAHAHSTVHHVTNRSFYCLPRYVPQEAPAPGPAADPAPKFVPLDLSLYDLSRRPEGEISASISTVPPEKASKGHSFLRKIIGGPHSVVGLSNLSYCNPRPDLPACSAITDTYLEFVRSGLIVPVKGWVDSVEPDENGGFVVTARARKYCTIADGEEVRPSQGQIIKNANR